ncbi:MAG TPA: DUF6263 family protein [Planctomycetota bacterium]|nr:DUF6263 family protein [Planctomycetota bacterium]
MNNPSHLRLLSLLCLTTPLLAQGTEHDLRIAAKKGTSVWLLQEAKQEQAIDMGGQQMDMGNTTVHTLHLTVKDVDDKGNLVVETEIVRIHGSMSNPMMGDIDFDSAKKAAGDDDDEGGGMGMSPGMITKAMTALAGKSFVARVDPFGKVASLEGVAELLADAKKNAGGMGGAMAQAASEATFRQFVESAFGTRPSKPMATGGTWDHADNEKGVRMPMRSKLQLTLAKVDADNFEVTAVGTVEKADAKGEEGDDSPMNEMRKSMKVKNGKVSGSQRVSRQDGFIVEAKNVTTMDLDMASPMGGDMSMNMKVTTTTKRTTADAAVPAKKAAPAKDEAKKEEGAKSGK